LGPFEPKFLTIATCFASRHHAGMDKNGLDLVRQFASRQRAFGGPGLPIASLAPELHAGRIHYLSPWRANLVFREWTMQWARRLIVKACIVEMDSEIKRTARKLPLGINKGALPRSGAFDFLPTNTPELFQEQLLTLDAVSCFVVVLRVLETL
jgi:hypothetical protein